MSDDQDDAQKTEDPTAKRVEESRKKGQVALSREFNNWIMLLAATLIVGVLAPSVFSRLKEHMKTYIELPHQLPAGAENIGDTIGESFWVVLSILTLPLLILIFAAFIGPFIQVGPLFAPEALKPDISKVSPMKGLKRLFSLRSVMEFVKGILKMSIVTTIGIVLLKPFYGRVELFVGMPIPLMLDELTGLFIRLMMGVLMALIVIAVIDVVFQRVEHMKKMRMSKQDIKDEYKQSEGDPHVRAKLRQLRTDRARQRMMQAVPEADVIITNPTHFSIALKYNPEEMDAPVCIAKGIDDVALRIREVAKEHNIVLYENRPLARVLYDTVDIDEIVPAEHYKAVAEVISYVFKLKGKLN